jgi:hypothetical protein
MPRLGPTPPRTLAGLATLAGVVLVLVILLRSVRAARHLDDPGVLTGLAVLAGVALAAFVAHEALVRLRVRRQVGHVRRRRPGTTVVVGRPTAALTAEARRLRAGTRHLPPDARDRDHVVYALLPDRVELWVRDDDGPRWWVTRPCRVTRGTARLGRRTVDALTVSDAAARLQLVPVADEQGLGFGHTRERRRAAFDRALAELSPGASS